MSRYMILAYFIILVIEASQHSLSVIREERLATSSYIQWKRALSYLIWFLTSDVVRILNFTKGSVV